jgi:hypothetical protein
MHRTTHTTKRRASRHNWVPAITDCSHESHNWSLKQPIAPLVDDDDDDDDDDEDDDGHDDGDDGDGDESSLSNTQTLTQ